MHERIKEHAWYQLGFMIRGKVGNWKGAFTCELCTSFQKEMCTI